MASGVYARECWIGLDERTGVIGARRMQGAGDRFVLTAGRGWRVLACGHAGVGLVRH